MNSSAPGAISRWDTAARTLNVSSGVGVTVTLARGLNNDALSQIVIAGVFRAVIDREPRRDRPIVVRVQRADVAAVVERPSDRAMALGRRYDCVPYDKPASYRCGAGARSNDAATIHDDTSPCP